MKVKIFFIVITLFLLPLNLMAQEPAKNWLNTKGKSLIEAFGIKDSNQKHLALDKLLIEDIDLDYISKFVLGKYYKDLTPAQTKRYQKAFKNYALHTYKQFPLDYGNSINFEVTEVYQTKRTINAKVNVSINPETIFNVEFALVPFNDTYKVVDLKIGEASLILSYRSRFYEMIAQSDGELEWFIEDLEALSEKKNGN